MLLNIFRWTGEHPTKKNYPAQNVSSVKAEKHCGRWEGPQHSAPDNYKTFQSPTEKSIRYTQNFHQRVNKLPNPVNLS